MRLERKQLFFYERLPWLAVQVWSKINCLCWISRGKVAWSDANALSYWGRLLSSVFDTRQTIHGTWNLLNKCWKCKKTIVPMVLMNRHINRSRCERYIMSVEFYAWCKKGPLLLRTGVLKAKAKNTHVQNSRYIKVQHHTVWYHPGKEAGYLRPDILKESNSVSDKKRFFSATSIWKVRAKSTHVLNSTYIKLQHHPIIFTS